MTKLTVGSVVFGEARTPQEIEDIRRHMNWVSWANAQMGVNHENREVSNSCACMGPQPGETKCPCQLRAEREKASSMLRDGVVIDGQRYRLVPEDKR